MIDLPADIHHALSTHADAARTIAHLAPSHRREYLKPEVDPAFGSDAAHRAEKWSRIFADADLRFAPNDAFFENMSIGSIPKVETAFGSDALRLTASKGA
jgi:hypothetical protein